MSKESTSMRLDKDIKERSYAIFRDLGVKPTQAMEMFLSQVILHKGLPFEVKIPNAETIAAIEEAEKGKLTSYASVDDLMDDLIN